MKTLLLIGGPSDGQRLDVPDRMHTIRVPATEPGSFEVSTYQLAVIKDCGLHEFLLWEGFNANLMETLLANYRPDRVANSHT